MSGENLTHENPGDEPDEFERSLAGELRRLEPAPDFADGVLGRLAREKKIPQRAPRANLLAMPLRRTGVKLGLAAALLIAILPAGYRLRDLQQRHRAEETEARFDLAMQLTSRTLAHVDREVDGTLQRTAKQSAEQISH